MMQFESAHDGTTVPTRRRSVRTHAAILDAATALVAERGYNRVTIEGIAARAGAGKQTVYRWWPSKALLFLELYRHLVPESSLIRDADAGGKDSVEADLHFLLRRLFELYAETPARLILVGVIAEAQGDPDVARSLRLELVEKRRSIVRRLFERGVARGELREGLDLDFNVDLVSSVVWFSLLQGDETLDRSFAERAVSQVLQALYRRSG